MLGGFCERGADAAHRGIGGRLLRGLAAGGRPTAERGPHGRGLAPREIIAGEFKPPTSLEIGPDGQPYVTGEYATWGAIQLAGTDGLATEVGRLPIDNQGERGLHGMAFDPDFATNRFVYLNYNVADPALPRNRLSRFRFEPTGLDLASEVVLLELDSVGDSLIHMGGAVEVLPDGTLITTTGDANSLDAVQSLSSTHGKVLRINRDGTIPADNPFISQTTGKYRAIYALGLRNPWATALDPVTGTLAISDVGSVSWEEVNILEPGANYGWPTGEGTLSNPPYVDPVFTYGHDPDDPISGCAITDGGFVRSTGRQLPAEFDGWFVVGDHCAGWVRVVDLTTGHSHEIFSGFSRLIGVAVDPADGGILYVDRDPPEDLVLPRGQLGVLRTTPIDLAILSHPDDAQVSQGETAIFSVNAVGSPPLTYQWHTDDGPIAGAVDSVLSLGPVDVGDDGTAVFVVVTDRFGASLTSDPATLTVLVNQQPEAVIEQPASDLLFRGGDVIAFSGTGTDAEDGVLGPDRFTWEVRLHHDEHSHDFVVPFSGSTSGTFTVPTLNETAPNIWYRIILTVEDSAGATHTVHRDVLPVSGRFQLATDPAGLDVMLDEAVVATPLAVDGVAGITRTLEAPPTQVIDGATWEFVEWSHGAARRHDLVTPDTASNTTYVARYRRAGVSLSIDSPVVGGVAAAPVVVRGRASDPLGVTRLGLVVRRLETGEYWSGLGWQAAWARVDVPFVDAGSSSVSWSFGLPADFAAGEYTVSVRSWNTANEQRVVSRRFTITAPGTG